SAEKFDRIPSEPATGCGIELREKAIRRLQGELAAPIEGHEVVAQVLVGVPRPCRALRLRTDVPNRLCVLAMEHDERIVVWGAEDNVCLPDGIAQARERRVLREDPPEVRAHP